MIRTDREMMREPSQNTEKMGPRRVGHRDSDLFLMSLAVDQQKECIITAS